MKAMKVVALVAAAAFVMVGCNSGATATTATKTPISLQLQWFPQAQFAGYFAALDKGYYADEGLDVTILPGAVDIVPATVVAGGKAQFGISWVPRMLAPREAGADLQVIGQVFQRSATTQVAFKSSGISTVADFKGKKIGSWGFGNEFELLAGMKKAGLDPDKDVTIVPQQFDMNAFVAGDIDAAQAMTYNEYAQVLETINPATGKLFTADDLNVITWESQGTAMLQDAIFASEAWIAQGNNKDIAIKFLKASFRGWIFCRDNAAECVDIVLQHDAKLPKGHQTWQLNEVNALVWPSPSGIGIMDQAAFDRTVQISIDSAILKAAPTGQAFRNDLAQAALDALGSSVDTKGASWTKSTVTLTEGGK
jgi:NitT/TauT family transport system substrate-binding protein